MSLPPGLVLMLGGLLLPMLPKALRNGWSVLLPAMVLAYVLTMPAGASFVLEALGREFHVLSPQPFSKIFATAFAIAALGGALFAYGKDRMGELVSAYIYAGAAMGVVYCGDFVSLLVFWELMVIGSVLVLWFSGNAKARGASLRYAAIHLLGGVLMMQGIAMLIYATGQDQFMHFLLDWRTGHASIHGLMLFSQQAGWPLVVAIWSILLGIMVNLAAPPFSAWLSESYPEASSSGAVFLSAFTTKTAVYVLLTLFWGNDILLAIGMVMVFYGIVMAMIENDMRRILAYSIISQVGFMVTAIGIGTPLALAGAAAHAFCHIIYKGLLMMSAGAVMEQTGGKRKCTELGGLYHSMPVTTGCAIVGAMAIASFPFTSGFVSKGLIGAAAAKSELYWVWMGLMAASASAFMYVALRYVWFVYFQRDSGLRPSEPNLLTRVTMIAFAALCLVPGFYPAMIYDLLPINVTYEPNTLGHVVPKLQLSLFACLSFFLLLPWLRPRDMVSLDVDWLYRKPLLVVARYLLWLCDMLRCAVVNAYQWVQAWLLGYVRRAHAGNGVMVRSASTGAIMQWVSMLLAIYLLVYYW